MAQKDDSLNTRVYTFSQNRVGQKVGNGTCWALPQKALENAGAKTSYDYQEVTDRPDQDYVWGKPVNLREIQKGDILQFRNHEVKIIYDMSGKMFFPDGKTAPFTASEGRQQTRPQHSAVVSSNYGKGIVVIFEQHVNTPGKNRDSVQKNQIYIDSQGSQKGTPKTRSYDLLSQRDINKLMKMFGKDTIQDYRKIYKKGKIRLVEDKRTFKVIVSGQIWAYRPAPKE